MTGLQEKEPSVGLERSQKMVQVKREAPTGNPPGKRPKVRGPREVTNYLPEQQD